MKKMTMSVKELAIVAMIGAVTGVLFTFLDGLYNPLSALLGPVFISLTFGLYALSALIPAFVIRKPGAALIGALIAAGINILTGSPYGIHIVVAGLLQGLGAEVGFAIFRYKKWDWSAFAVAAVFIVLFVSLRDYFVFGLGALPVGTLLLTVAVRYVSAVILGYLICAGLGVALQKVGLMKKPAEHTS